MSYWRRILSFTYDINNSWFDILTRSHNIYRNQYVSAMKIGNVWILMIVSYSNYMVLLIWLTGKKFTKELVYVLYVWNREEEYDRETYQYVSMVSLSKWKQNLLKIKVQFDIKLWWSQVLHSCQISTLN